MEVDRMLTVGAISQILEDYKPANPVLQIIGYKPMTPDQMSFGQVTDELRYRLMIGDGVKAHQYCVITNQDIVEDIKNGRLEKWSIVKVLKKGSEIGRKITVQQPVDEQPMDTNHKQENNFNHPHEEKREIRQPTNNFNSNYMDSTQPQPYVMGGGMQPDLIRSPRSMRGSHDHQTININELTPYIGKWIIKGRVTSKSGIREYNNAKGGGKLFSFTIADKSGEIKITAFNADCERVFGYVEVNKVYYLGRANVRNADKRYTTADFEITLNNDSLVEEVVDSREANEVPLAKFNFTSIATLPLNQPVDMIGAIIDVSECTTIISRTKNKELKKRNITIVDMSRYSIAVTLWGEQSENFSATIGDVFVTKAARVGTYGGKSASAGDCVFINPEIPEVRKVKNWYNNLLDHNFTALTSDQGGQGSGDQWKFIKDMTDIEQIKIITSSGNQSALYGKTMATLISVGKNPVYKCCPVAGCGKKLIDTQNGEMKCEKCQQTHAEFKYRYKTDIEIGDISSSCWTTLWDEKAEAVLKMRSEELEKYMKMENKETYERIMTKPNFLPFIFTLRSRIDTYSGEDRVKLQVINMTPLNCEQYSKKLIEDIRKNLSS